MLRTLKFSLVCLSMLLVSAHCQTALADMVTYEMGPYFVQATGPSDKAAASNAYGKMYDMVDEIEQNLPEGHVILEVVVEKEELNAPLSYFIKFHVVVWIPTPPGPPNGT